MPRWLAFALFFILLVALVGALQFALYRLAAHWARVSLNERHARSTSRAMLAVMGLGNALLLGRVLVSRGAGYASAAGQAVIWGGSLYASAVLFAVWMTLQLAFVLLVIRLVRRRPLSAPVARPESPERRRVLQLAGGAFVSAAFGVPALVATTRSRRYIVRPIELSWQDLPAALDGLRIAQISDLHSGVFMPQAQLREVMALVMEQRADLIVLTGDFADHGVAELPALAATLPALGADLGVYGVLGNHDHYAPADKVRAAVGRGVTVLTNERRVLTIGGAQLVVAGIDDAGHYGAFHGSYADLDAALGDPVDGAFTMLLSHQPRMFDEARARGVALTLSGHTHGGQILGKIGGLSLNPVYLVYDYVNGLYVRGGQQLYVNPGIGMVGIPIRLVPPEVTVMTLRRAV